MVKKVVFYVAKEYQQNRIFDLNNQFLNRDNSLLGFVLLKQKLEKYGVKV